MLVVNMLISFGGIKKQDGMNYHVKTGLKKLVDILTIVLILVVSDYSPSFPMECFLFKVPLYFIDLAVFVFFLYEIILSFGAYRFFYSKAHPNPSWLLLECLLWRVITGRTSQINAWKSMLGKLVTPSWLRPSVVEEEK